MEQRLKELNLHFERIEAFDARLESLEGKVRNLRAFIYHKLRRPPIGHIGVYVSHRRVWQRMIDQKIDHAMVLEDDVVASDWDPEILNVNLVDRGIDLLRLERNDGPGYKNLNPLPQQKYDGKKLIGRTVSNENTWGTAAYICTQAGAKKCLSAGAYWFCIDHFRMWTVFYDLRTAVLMPPMWKQTDSPSDVASAEQAFATETAVDKAREIPRKIMLGAIKVWKNVSGR
jgi:glycosyl transferase, family 25